MQIMSLNVATEVVAFAEKACPLIIEEFCKDRVGGYLYIADSLGYLLLHQRIGNPPTENKKQYIRFSAEKVARLAENSKHYLSWQSRNHEKKQFAGGVKVNFGFISFSGFPEMQDEAFVLCLASKFRLVSLADVAAFTDISNNLSLVSDMMKIMDKIQ